MSIATRTGDDGTTGIMFGHRLSKTDGRIEAYGTVDELNAVIGLARSYREDRWLSEELRRIQKELIVLMGELAVLDEDRSKYLEKGFPVVDDNMVRHLDGNQFQFISPAQFAVGGAAGRAVVESKRGGVILAAMGTVEGRRGLLDVEPRALGGGAGGQRFEREPQRVHDDAGERSHAHAQGADRRPGGGGRGGVQQIRHQAQLVHGGKLYHIRPRKNPWT